MSLARSAFSLASSALHALSFALALFALSGHPSLAFGGLLVLSGVALADSLGAFAFDPFGARGGAPAKWFAAAGGLLAMIGGALDVPGASAAGVLGALGLAAYLARQLWAVTLESRPSVWLAPGAELPPFELSDLEGTPIPARELRGAPLILVFHRGVFSPRCMRMLAAFARAAPSFERLGAQLWFVGGGSIDDTRDLARRLGGGGNVAHDEASRAAHALGIAEPTGAPAVLARLGVPAFTARPTVIVTDARLVVRFVDQPGDVRVRPSPERVFGALVDLGGRSLGATSPNSSLADESSSVIEHVPLPSPKESS